MLDGCASVSGGDAGAVQSTIHGITGGQVPKPGVGDDEEVGEVEDGVGDLIGEASSAQDDGSGPGQFVEGGPQLVWVDEDGSVSEGSAVGSASPRPGGNHAGTVRGSRPGHGAGPSGTP